MVSRGWSYFLIGLLLSSFLGGAIRVYFSPQRIRVWVDEVSARKQPKFTLDFKEARLAFADGWTPGLAVEFIDLRIRARDICITGSEIQIDRINLPIQASAVFSQKVKFGVIGAEELKINIRQPKCESTLAIPKAVEDLDQLPRLVRLEKFMKTRWRQEVRNTVRLLDGLRIDRLLLFQGDSEAPVFSINNFEAKIDSPSDSAILEFSLEPGVSLVGHQHVGRLRSYLELSPDALKFSGRGNLKEGQYQLGLDWDVNSGFWDGQLQMQDMPAANLISLMDGWGMLNWPELNPRNQWFRCQLKAEGSLVAWKSSPVRFESCGFYGELGEIHIRAGESRLFEGQLYPITADFRNVDMGPLLLQFGQLRHWVGQDGSTSGDMKILDKGRIQYKGLWRKPKFKTSMLNVFKMGGIKIDQIHLSWDYSPTESVLKISEPTAYGEDFPLEMRFTEDLETASASVTWNVNWVQWPKAMTKLTDKVIANGLSTKGSALLDEASPTIKFQLSADELIFGDIKIKNLKSDFKFEEAKGDFSANAQSVELQASTSMKLFLKMFDELNEPSLLAENFNFKAEFDQPGRWVVNPLRFSRAEFIGRGFKMAVDQGVFKVIEKGKTIKNYNIFGSLEEPRFEVAQ